MRFTLQIAVTLAVLAGAARAGEAPVVSNTVPRIDPAVVELFRHLPVQEEGRIKPIDTYARFKLLRYQGKRTLRLGHGKDAARMSAAEWLLVTLIHPEQAEQLPVFKVDNSDVIVAIGAPPREHKRDAYSYADLKPYRGKLLELGRKYDRIEAKLRTPHQRRMVNLASNLAEYEFLLHGLDIARETFTIDERDFPGVVTGRVDLAVSGFLRRLPELSRRASESRETLSESKDATVDVVADGIHRLASFMQMSGVMYLFPPAAPEKKEWGPVGGLVGLALEADTRETGIRRMALVEGVVRAANEPSALRGAMEALLSETAGAARERGEYERVPLEATYYRLNLTGWSLNLYVLGFTLVAISWLFASGGAERRSALRRWAAGITLSGPLVAGTVTLTIAIVMRCIIRHRPPVSTLYETILFITAVSVAVALVMEWISRRRVALAVAAALGVIGMFMANRYETREGTDTMPALIAVLDTNFWLATHVTCITIGYAAGLLAAAFAHVYAFARIFGAWKKRPDLYASLGRMVYGTVCFELLFSFVGTMLGGIWANESWGRFWGWDPKENGALLICLWSIILLHARLGRYIRDFGFALGAIAGGCVVTFSWWGVNLLGVGLHSYGFISGVFGTLMALWAAEAAIIVVALLRWRGAPDEDAAGQS